MSLHRLRWLVLGVVLGGMLLFEYARHFVWPEFLHAPPAYLLSVATIALVIILFNQSIFDVLDQTERRLLVQNQHLATMNAIAATVSRSLDLNETLNEALDIVIAVMGMDAAGIHLVEENRLPLKVFRNLPAEFVEQVRELKMGEELPGRVAESGQPIVVQENASNDPRLEKGVVRQQGFESIACIPLIAKGKVVGVMPMATYARREFTPPDLELLSAIGNQIGVAIENARLHAQVQQQAAYLTTLIESSGNAIISADLQGNIVSWNRGAEEIYGWRKEETLGKNFPMVPESLRSDAARLMKQMLATGETIRNYETQRLRNDGEQIPVMVTASPIHDANGKITRFLGISTDMREKKRLEQELLQQQRALAVLQERERLARELHDSLGQILGYVNTQSQAVRELLAKKQTEAADTYLKRLVEVAQDAHADVREYILSLQTNPLGEQDFIPALRGYLERFSQQNGIACDLRVPDELQAIAFEPNVGTQLMRIVQEALTNVRKHARAQTVAIRFQRKESCVQIEIADDGAGFDAGKHADESQHFGRRIMRERAVEIGGTIEVESAPGKGTRVFVSVPPRKNGGA